MKEIIEKLLAGYPCPGSKPWYVEELKNGQFAVYAHEHGAITIDFSARGYALGYGVYVRYSLDRKYCGRGWRGKLISDAINEYLRVTT